MEQTNLTVDQVSALEFMKTNEKFSLLKGSAGVGKTTVVGEFCNRNKNVLLTAPTHKAVQVLRGKTKSRCKTIHSFLKLKRQLVGGKYEYVFDQDEDFDDISILVVDEASMINSQLLEWIMVCANVCNFRVVFVGDEKQLNPVKENDSPVFHQSFEEFELTEIIRHQNDIIDLSRNLEWLYEKRNGNNFEWFKGNEIPLDMLIESNGTDKAKFITWSNKLVELVNKEVRNRIYHDPGQFEIGETILMKEPFKDLYKNNEEIKIETLKYMTHFFNDADIPYPDLQCFIINGDLMVLNLEDENKYKQNVDDLLQKAKLKIVNWKTYYKYLESFGKYQYNHAVTVHKSQGSTYEYSFVNISEILRNPNIVERDRMLYTAITRAEKKNFLL